MTEIDSADVNYGCQAGQQTCPVSAITSTGTWEPTRF